MPHTYTLIDILKF